MANHEYDRPWQVTPTKIIKLALEHAKRNDDLDHQVAFLLLDIGVETALKIYVINRGHDVEKIHFPGLLDKVKEELSKTNRDFVNRIEDVRYFHGLRNKLYHQGDGVKPTEENLARYSELAKQVIQTILGVDLQAEEKKTLTTTQGKEEIEEVMAAFEARFKFFYESCAIITEKVRPQYATREFAMKVKYILDVWPDFRDDPPEIQLENRAERLQQFNELTGAKQTDYQSVDFMLNDINHFYVRIALKQIRDEWFTDWEEYQKIYDYQYALLQNWKRGIKPVSLTDEQVRQSLGEAITWVRDQEEKMGGWIDEHLKNIKRLDLLPFDYLSIQDLDDLLS